MSRSGEWKCVCSIPCRREYPRRLIRGPTDVQFPLAEFSYAFYTWESIVTYVCFCHLSIQVFRVCSWWSLGMLWFPGGPAGPGKPRTPYFGPANPTNPSLLPLSSLIGPSSPFKPSIQVFQVFWWSSGLLRFPGGPASPGKPRTPFDPVNPPNPSNRSI